MRSVREVMESRSLAVIGASRNPQKAGSMLIQFINETGFQGRVAGVNPQGGEIHGVTLYPSLDEIPFDVDLCVFYIPPKLVPPVLADCAKKGVKGVVISSEGFAESGPEGRAVQEEVRRVLQDTGMRAFGPNTLGVINTQTGLTTSYFADKQMLTPGSIGFATQSGIFIGAVMRYMSSVEGLSLSKGLGLGNKVDVDESEALAYLMEDEQTKIIGLYLEDIRDGRRFLETAREAVSRKPVLVLKSGRSPQGARASVSHTGSMAVDDAVLDGALRQAGVLRMSGLEEFIGTLMGFQWMPLPQGDRLALVTYSGAQAIMSIDKAVDLGLEVARFTQETRDKISKVIATPAKAENPVDLYPDMNTHGFEKTTIEVLKALLDDDGVHGIIFVSFAMFGVEPYFPLMELLENNRTKPVFFSILGEKECLRGCTELMRAHRIPVYVFPETAVQVFANMRRYAKIAGGV